VNLAVQVFRVRVDAPPNWGSVDVCPVVAEALADRAGFFRREREVLRELDRVAVVDAGASTPSVARREGLALASRLGE
jgi:hypothetical protein